MLTSLLFALSTAHHAQTPPTASGLISKMFARYSAARTLGGTIRTTQTAPGAMVVTDTNVAYERPSKLRLEQRQTLGGNLREKRLVSDGVLFHYTPPAQIVTSTPFLHEPVRPAGREAQTVGDLYAVVAADLPDRSPILDALISRKDDNQYFANQLAKFHLAGRETIGGRTVNAIEGDWREIVTVLAVGKFKMYLTDDGDLVRYVLTQDFAPPKASGRAASGEKITVTTTWDAAITVDAPIRPETFVFRG